MAPPFREEERRRVGDVAEAPVGHLEHADLVGRAEAVLDGAQDAELVTALAFEVEHRVDHVLENTRPRDGAVLCDVADQQHGDPAALGEFDQRLRRCTDLRDRARCRIDGIEPHGLDRIDHCDLRRVGPLQRRHDVAHRGCGDEMHVRIGEPQPLGSQADLVDGFFARDVGTGGVLFGERRRHLQHQRRFADAGIAADQ